MANFTSQGLIDAAVMVIVVVVVVVVVLLSFLKAQKRGYITNASVNGPFRANFSPALGANHTNPK